MRRKHRFAVIVALLALAGLVWWALQDGSKPAPAEPPGPATTAAQDNDGRSEGPGDRRRRVRLPGKESAEAPATDDSPSEEPSKSAPVAEAPQRENLPEGPAAVGELVGRGLLFPDRSPIEGAVVRVRWGVPGRDVVPYPDPEQVTTGPNGIFRIAGFAPGTYQFEAALEGRAPRRFRVVFTAAQPADEVEVLFGAGGRVEGRLESADGPAAGVTVRINRSGVGGGPGLLSGTTDAAGEFRFEDLPPGAYGLEVDGAGAFHSRTASVTVIAGETSRVEFASQAFLAGVVTWDGERLAEAIVRVARNGGEYRSEQSQSAADGAFRVDGLTPGEHRITVQVLDDPGFAVDVATTTLVAGENRMDLLLGQGDLSATISGQLSTAVPGGAPPSRAQITFLVMTEKAEGTWELGAQVAMAFPDASGAFRVRGLRPGRYHVMVYPRGGNLQTARVDVTLAPGERKGGFEIQLEAREPREPRQETPSAAVLSGVVTDGGRPLARAFVRVAEEAGEGRSRQTRTDEMGRYLVKRLDPGKWRVHVQVVGKGGFAAEVALAEIAEGRNRLDIRLDSDELAGEIRGRVIERVTGRALTSKDVVLWLTTRVGDAMGRHVGMTNPDASGSFRFRHVRGGQYRILATPRGGSLRNCEVDVDVVTGQTAERVEVSLEELRTGAVRFVVRQEDGTPVRQVKISSMLDGEARQGSMSANSDSGVYETHFEIGVHEITVGDGSDSVRAAVTVDVGEGETTVVEVVLLPPEQ